MDTPKQTKTSTESLASVALNTPTHFQLKADFCPLTVIKLNALDHRAIEEQLNQVMAKAPNYFEYAPVVLDVSATPPKTTEQLTTLFATLRHKKIIPIGIRGLDKPHHETAISQGLAIMRQQATPISTSEKKTETDFNLDVSTISKRKAATAPSSARSPQTKLITSAVRAGTQVYAKGSDLIIMAPVNAGAEVIADGHIHIYGPLRGRALAGANGNPNAHIFCLDCQAELVAIDGIYLVKEQLDATISQRFPVTHITLEHGQLKISGIR